MPIGLRNNIFIGAKEISVLSISFRRSPPPDRGSGNGREGRGRTDAHIDVYFYPYVRQKNRRLRARLGPPMAGRRFVLSVRVHVNYVGSK